MRERSHKKGEVYQKDVKHWLSQCTFLGFDVELFGDAYDVTKKACTIGDVAFDFSLRLGRGDLARHILYAECKYRDERKGNINADFRDFLNHVRDAMTNAEPDDAASAMFVFLSNVPPDNWRGFLNNRLAVLKAEFADVAVDEQLIARLAEIVHVLVLDARIVRRN